MDTDKPLLSSSYVYSALKKGKPIENVTITETIDLERHFLGKSAHKGRSFDIPVVFRNCYIKTLWIPLTTCTKRFIFENCVIESAGFYGCYLIEGITISNCTFKDDMYLFYAGGHNKPDVPVVIKDTVFHGFVDFLDAWFMGPVRITGCNFMAGTNLLGNIGKSYSVKFDVPPELIDNKGKLDMDESLTKGLKSVPISNLPNITLTEQFLSEQIKKPRKRFLWF